MTACPKMTVIRDKRYRDSAPRQMCAACFPEHAAASKEYSVEIPEVVLAHINIAGNFGRGLKAGDDESFFLCHRHHQEMDQYPAQRDRWIVQNIVLPMRKAAFRKWEAGK